MSRPESAQVIVVGAGVVGLAVARALAQIPVEVLIIEADPSFGMGTSVRGSSVIHRRTLLFSEHSQGAHVCQRTAAAVCVRRASRRRSAQDR